MKQFANQSFAAIAALLIAVTSIGAIVTVPPAHAQILMHQVA
ncbi:MAG: hypothetical protein ABJP48_06490 [Erythrobacter sp.]